MGRVRHELGQTIDRFKRFTRQTNTLPFIESFMTIFFSQSSQLRERIRVIMSIKKAIIVTASSSF